MINELRECIKSPGFRREFASLIAASTDMLTVDPAYTCRVAQRLIPMNEKQLAYWLNKLHIPKRYRVFKIKRNGDFLPQRHRMLYASEIKLIREAATRGEVNHAEQVLTKIIKTSQPQENQISTST